MKAKEERFLYFLEGSNKHFVIPVYQRNYDWKNTHCKQLYKDLVGLSKNDKTHFLGSIVFMYHDYGYKREYLIIDGQQRLTTISILLLAIYNLIDEGEVKAEITKKQIREIYLINDHYKDDKKIKLKSVKNDKVAFACLFKTKDDYLPDTNITANYLYFYNKIQEEKISIDELFSAIKQLVIIEIELKNGEDDPQLIFESLNSTGLDLTEADKVRNFVLMKENPTVQERFYNDYWNKIELNTNYNVSDFIRHYLTIKERSIPNKGKVYFHFKNYTYENNLNNEKLLLDLLKYSKYYKQIITTNNDELFSRQLTKINRLETDVSYPFLMEVFDDYTKRMIKEEDLVEILEIVISFVFRRLICEVSTNALNKIFMVLGRDIKKHNDYKNNYLEVFKMVITQKSQSGRFPDDKEFTSKILTKDIYNFKNKYTIFLLEQLENFENKERVNIEELVSSKELTIEHIMPQTLSAEWKNSLGAECEEIYEEYLNSLGNITLTGYNSKMSNKSFIEKRDMTQGFKESRLFLNRMLSEFDKWDKDSIIKRAAMLKDKSLKIWKYPHSEYQSIENKLESFTLDDKETNFTGMKVLSFRIMRDKEIKVTSWKKFYEEVSKQLFSLDPTKFKHLVKEHNYIKESTFKKEIIKIGDFYLKSNLSSEAILTRLRTLVDGIGLDLNEISFDIK